MNELVDSKMVQIDKTCFKLETTLREIDLLKAGINDLDLDINDVERLTDRHLDLQKKMLRQKDNEIVRGQD